MPRHLEITAEVLQFLDFNPDTCLLQLRDPTTKPSIARPHGTSQWKILGRFYSSHRLAYALHNPDRPQPRFIDFADGNRFNLSPANLIEGVYIGVGSPRGQVAETKNPLPHGIHHNPSTDTYDVAYLANGTLLVVGSGYATLAEAATAMRVHRQLVIAGEVPEMLHTRRNTDTDLTKHLPQAIVADDIQAALAHIPPADAEPTPAPTQPSPIARKLASDNLTTEQRRIKMRDVLNGTYSPATDYSKIGLPTEPVASIEDIEAQWNATHPAPVPTPASNAHTHAEDTQELDPERTRALRELLGEWDDE